MNKKDVRNKGFRKMMRMVAAVLGVVMVATACTPVVAKAASIADAVDIALNTAITDSRQGGANYYKIEVPNDGHISVTMTYEYEQSGYFDVTFYDDNVNTLMESRHQLSSTKPTTSGELGISQGTYYIRVTGSNNSYSIVVNYTSTDNWEKELNDTIVVASPIDVNKEYHGSISWRYGERDYYMIRISKPGALSVTFSHGYGTSGYWDVELRNDDNQKMLEKRFQYSDLKPKSSAKVGVDAGTYYFVVTNGPNDQSTYNFTVNYEMSDTWEREPNNNVGESTPINTGVKYYGSLHNGSAADFYSFDISGQKEVYIEFEHEAHVSGYWDVLIQNMDNNPEFPIKSGSTVSVGSTSVH